MKKVLLGTKYYKQDEDNIIIIKIVRMKNENSIIVRDETTKEEFKVDRETLIKDYIKLKEDGYISFSIVNLQDKMKDVIVALMRREDIENGDNLPYCACRQSVYDMFTNQIIKGNHIFHVGMSVSKNTIPEDVPYETMLACENIEYMLMVSYYIGDKLDDVLSLFKHSKFDNLLLNIHSRIEKSKDKVYGYCKSLNQLLKENDFEYDLLSGYDILRLPFKIQSIENEEGIQEIISEQRKIIEDVKKVEMFKTYVIKFNKEINLKNVERNYMLVSDIDGDLYILAYDKGEYINRHYRNNIKDKRDAACLLKYRKNR